MKAVELGQAVANTLDWLAAERERERQRDYAGPAGDHAHVPRGRGRDELVYRVARGDGREPDPQVDVLVQRGRGVQARLVEGDQQGGAGQQGQQPGLRAARAG